MKIKFVVNVKWPTFLLVMGVSPLFLLFLPVISSVPSSILQLSKLLPTQEHNKLSTLPLVLASWQKADKTKDKYDNEKKSISDSKEKFYDFIVVGAGTAGSICAARLTENHYSVLLLEAGGQPHATHENTGMSMVLSKHPENDWMYSSVVQNETCVLCPEKKYTFSAGKGLGGSANLNYLDTLYEGEFQDYTEWMEATKDPGWGYYMLQPYFKTVKQYMTKDYPVSTGENEFYRSTFKALVRPSSNLEIQKYSNVNKILYDEDGRAAGVEYEKHGSLNLAFATKEIIISGGVFGSPKILMLSGIGPHEILATHNISIRADLPVGKNLQDHLAIPLGPFFKSKTPDSEFKFLDYKTDSSDSWNSTTVLRMPLINLNYNLYSKEMSHFLGINEGALKRYMDSSSNKFEKITGSDSMFINVALKKPASRGEVIISGKNPTLSPLISPNYLNAIYHHDSLAYSSEKQTLIEALEETVRLMENNPTLKSKFTEAVFPGCESYIFRGFGYWDCFIRHMSMSLNHFVGTCAMGASPSSSVVNPELQVHGVPGLRVIDASVMPRIVGTYPFQSVAVIAEKGVEMIIKHYKSSRNIVQTLSRIRIESVSAISNSSSVVPQEDTFTHHSPPTLQPSFAGFRIKKLSTQEISTTTQRPTTTNATFSIRKLWQKTDQILQGYSHSVGSSLSEDDLIPPGEPPTDKPNPTYFAVKPFGSIIFYPLIPQTETTTTSTEATVLSLKPNI